MTLDYHERNLQMKRRVATKEITRKQAAVEYGLSINRVYEICRGVGGKHSNKGVFVSRIASVTDDEWETMTPTQIAQGFGVSRQTVYNHKKIREGKQ